MKTVGRIVMMILALASAGFPIHITISGTISGKCITSDGLNPRFVLKFQGYDQTFANFSDTTFPGNGIYTSNKDSSLMGGTGQWRGTVTPSYSGFLFAPASRTYSYIYTSQSNQDYVAIDTSKPQVSLAPITSEITVGNVLNISSKIVDNSNQVLKIKYFLSLDSGKTFSLIDTFIPTTGALRARQLDASITDTGYSWFPKQETFTPTINNISLNCQIKTEAMDPNSNIGEGYSNIFSVKPITSIFRTPPALTPSCFTQSEKVYNIRGQIINRLISAPFSLTKIINSNGQKMILKIK